MDFVPLLAMVVAAVLSPVVVTVIVATIAHVVELRCAARRLDIAPMGEMNGFDAV